MTQLKCKDRVQDHYNSRLSDLKILWYEYCNGIEDNEEIGTLNEYGLGFDYVAPGEGYFRYQLSWGGPSEEFRIYADGLGNNWSIYRIEFWFLDWFDGAHIVLQGEDFRWFINFMAGFLIDTGSFGIAKDNTQ